MSDTNEIIIDSIDGLVQFASKHEHALKTALALSITERFLEKINKLIEKGDKETDPIEIVADEITKVYAAMSTASINVIKHVVNKIEKN